MEQVNGQSGDWPLPRRLKCDGQFMLAVVQYSALGGVKLEVHRAIPLETLNSSTPPLK